jgi:hypothetical protein
MTNARDPEELRNYVLDQLSTPLPKDAFSVMYFWTKKFQWDQTGLCATSTDNGHPHYDSSNQEA